MFRKYQIKLSAIFLAFSVLSTTQLTGMEKILDSSVKFEKSKPDFTLVSNLLGFLKGEEPKERPQQSVLAYREEVKGRQEETVLMRGVPGIDGRTRVAATGKYPYSCFCHTNTVFGGASYGGSGVMIGKNHILTAAHCVFNLKKREWAEQISVYCGLSGDMAPFGKCEVVRIYVPEEYVRDENEEFDVALLIIDRPMGLQTGHLGCLFSSDIKMFEEELNITGYPGDKGFKEMWTMANKVKNIGCERINYDIDTFGGQSGSPVWSRFGLDHTGETVRKLWPLVVGIHTHGERIVDEGNSGIRLTEYKFKLLIDWITQTGTILEKLIKSPSSLSSLLVNNGTPNASGNDNNAPGQPANQSSKTVSEDDLLLATLFELKINERDGEGKTILHKAIGSGNVKLVKLLIAKGASVQVADSLDRSPLYLAAMDGHIEIVELLLQNQASVATADNMGLTPLHVAVKNGHQQIVKLLIVMDGQVLAPDKKGNTPLRIAVDKGDLEMVELLLSLVKDVDITDSTHLKWSPSGDNRSTDNLPLLHLAVTKGYIKIVELLLNKHERMGKNITDLVKANPQLLQSAAKGGHYAVAVLLLEAGADIDWKNGNGWTALHCVTWERLPSTLSAARCAIVELLLNKGADSKPFDTDQRTLLHNAATSGSPELVELLLMRGFNINAPDKNGKTPLHDAASSSRKEVVELLLRRGAQANVCEKSIGAPIHWAICNGNAEIVEVMVENGVDKNQTTSMKLLDSTQHRATPLILATKYYKPHIVKVLLKAGVDVNATTDTGWTALHWAAKIGCLEIVELLVESGASLNMVAQDGTKNGKTEIEFAEQGAAEARKKGCNKGHDKVIQFLVKKGAKRAPNKK